MLMPTWTFGGFQPKFLNLKVIRIKMKESGETIPAIGGTPRANPTPAAKLRLAGLILIALLRFRPGHLGKPHHVERVDHLQREFVGLKAKDFYLAVHLKGKSSD